MDYKSTYKKTHPDFGNNILQFYILPSHQLNYHNTYIIKSNYLLLLTEKRKEEVEKIREKFPDRIPIIVEKAGTSKLPDIDKTK